MHDQTHTDTALFRYPVWPNWDELSCFYWDPEDPWRRGSLGPERTLCPGRPPCLEPKWRSCSKVPHPLQEMRFIQDHQPTAISGVSRVHKGHREVKTPNDKKRGYSQVKRGKRSNKNRKESIQIIQLTGRSHILGVLPGKVKSTRGTWGQGV